MEEKNNNDILRICKEYGFDDKVTEVVVNYSIKFASGIADNWKEQNIRTYNDLEVYREKRKELRKFKQDMSKIIKNEKILADERSWNNKLLTFDNWVLDKKNMFANTVAEEIVKSFPKITYNPLFIYGQNGSGKTHLIQAIR